MLRKRSTSSRDTAAERYRADGEAPASSSSGFPSSSGLQQESADALDIENDNDADMAAAIAASLASISAASGKDAAAADDNLKASAPALIDPGPEPNAGRGE